MGASDGWSRARAASAFFAVTCSCVGSLCAVSRVSSSWQKALSSNQTKRRGTTEFCLEHSGSSGRWIQDWAYANKSWYPNHGSYKNWHLAEAQFVATPFQPRRPATAYRWVDDACPVREVNLIEFCDACRALGIDRILTLGDSLSIQFVQSLQSLLGFPPEGRRAWGFKARLWPWSMSCPGGSPRITFLTIRRSPIGDWTQLRDQSRAKDGDARTFVEAPGGNRTAIIANLGAWMQSKAEYQLGFACFVEWLESLADPGRVLAFWRPTVPGHANCLPDGSQAPHANYAEYRRAQDVLLEDKNATGFGRRWELMEGWEEWSSQQLHRFHRGPENCALDDNLDGGGRSVKNGTSSNDGSAGRNGLWGDMTSCNRTRIHRLNILPSSLLRRDGHIGEDGDCLHYYLPGPIDWWSHFFHSALLDLADGVASPRSIDE